MKQVVALLNRWFKRFTGNLSNDIEVLPISLDTIDTATMTVYDYVRETQIIKDDHILTNIDGLLRSIVISGGFVGLAYLHGVNVGIICAQLAIPEIWDTRRTGNVSYIYVKPEFRTNPNILMSLINSVVVFFVSHSVEIIRVSCDSKELSEKYIKMFGFKEVYCQTILEVKES